MASKVVAFESSTIWPEIKAILESSANKILFDYKGVLHTEKEEVSIWDLTLIETVRDYATKISDSRTIRFKMGLGDYVSRVYPYRTNLEFTLKRIPLKEGGSGKFPNASSEVIRYKAILNPQHNPPVSAGELESHDPEDLNTSNIVEIELELVNRSVEILRVKKTGGCFRNIRQEDLIRSVLAAESSKILIDGRPSVDAIDIVKPDNREVSQNIPLKQSIGITALPSYLHEEGNGLYNGGIGTYFQYYEGKKTWFIYPLYSADRYEEPVPKAIFYAVPQEKLPQLDKSYRQDGKILKVAVTAQRRYTDSAEIDMMNEGSGFRMADARAFMKKPAQINSSGKLQASRANLNHEVAIVSRKDGMDYAPVVQGASSNPFAQRSKVLARTMGQIDLVWENADASLLYPGMPCKYVYLSQGKAVSLRGIILFVHETSSRVEKYNASAYRTNCRLSIVCEAQSTIPTAPVKGTASDT